MQGVVWACVWVVLGSLGLHAAPVSQIPRTVFNRLGIIQCFRLLITPLTTLPDPVLHCRPGPHLRVDVPAQVVDVLSRLGPIDERLTTCGGQAFSGQAGSLLAMVLVVRTFLNERVMTTPRRRRMVNLVSFAYALMYAALVIVSRKHYTVDVVLAYVVVLLMGAKFDVRPWESFTGWWPQAIVVDARNA